MKNWFEGTLTRRLLSLALSIVMVLSLLPAGALAEEGENTSPSCTCEVACAEGAVNTDCQVCAEDMSLCTSAQQQEQQQEPAQEPEKEPELEPEKEPEPENLLPAGDTVLTSWEWVDPDEWLDETGSFAMPGVTEDCPAYFEDVVEYLPTQITALIDGGEVTLDFGDWSCDDYPVETGTSQGEFVFTATLPEGYVLADGSNTLPLPVTVAPMDLSDGEDVSGYDYKGSGLNESWDDVSFNGVRNWNKETSEFDFGSSNTTMYYRKITKQYTGDVEWTKYDHHKTTVEDQTGYYIDNVGYCVYSETAEITGTLTINADIHLVLWADGMGNDSPDMVLTVGNIQIPEGKTLTIWTRNAGYQGGKLIVEGDISGGGTLVVRDGYVEAQNITCQFSTGGSENGKQSLGVVKANSISDKSDEANWGGVIVENGVGRACGTAAQELIYDLQCDTLTIDSGKTLTVGWDGYNNIGARHNVKLIANNLVNNGTLINKAKLYYNTLSGSGRTDPSNGGYGYYQNENGQKVYRLFTLVTSDITELTNTADTNDGWYLVSGNVEWANRVAVAATKTVNLVLADGCTLTAKEGITVGGAGNPTLIIWCQEAGTGTLNAQTSNKECAAIGMNEGDNTGGGKITIHGGNINAEYTGSGSINPKNCGLGGHYIRAFCTVTINGGTINTPALVSDNLTINGGTITVSNLISGWFLAPATDGGSTFVTAGDNWAGGTSNRRGLFFVGDTGEVCTGSGTELTLARAMEVPAGKTLVISQGKTLIAGNYLTNKGAVCVGGAYTGSLGGNGEVYYRLSVEGGTAASATDTKPIDDVTYVKAGSTVTLTPGAAPTGKRFDHWNLPAGLTLTDNTFTMPDKAVDISAAYSDAVVITQQPEPTKTIIYGDKATLSVTAQNPSGGTDGITYQWYKGTEKLPNETSKTLSLRYLDASTQPYSFYCEVSCNGVSINSNTATVTVNKAQASVTINSDPSKTYDGTPVATPSYTVSGSGYPKIEYKLQSETVNAYTETPPTDADSYTVRVTMSETQNYKGASATKDFTINKAYNQWVVAPKVKNPAYYGDTDLVTYQAKYGNENVNVRYLGENDQPVNSVNAGDYDVIVSLSEVDNYTGLTMVKMPLTILPRPIDETDISVEPGTFEYGGTTKTPTVTVKYKDKTLVKGKDYVLSGDISGTAADTYTLTITGLGNFSGTTSKKWNITKASITPVVSLDDTVYGENLNPSINSDGNPGDGDVTYTYYSDENCTNVVTPKNVGTYYVKAAVAETTNYQQATTDAKSFQITKAPLTVKAKDKTITYGDAPANDGVTYDGFVNEETESVLGGTLAYDYSYSQYGNVGDYTITPKGLTSGNYAITFAPGKLTVAKKEIGIEWSNTSLAYNKAEQAPTATATGLVNNDECTITVTGQKTDVGNYTATAASLSNGNYKLPKEVTQAFDIYAVAPTARLEDAKSVYTGSEVPLLTVTAIDGGIVHYSLDKTDWSTEIPKAIQCGAYTVYYYVTGDSNHTDIGSQEAPESITTNILPFTASTPTASASDFEYGTETKLAFSVKTDLTGDITYQWFEVTTDKNGTSVHTPLPGETQNSMALIPNAGEHTYICVATCDGYSQDSEPVVVQVDAVSLTNVNLKTDDEPGESENTTKSVYWLEGGEAPAADNQAEVPRRSPSSGFLTRYSEVTGTDESKGYPTGMDVYELVEEKGTLQPQRVEIFTDLLKYEGCSIRISGKPGIRMITSIDEKLKKELIKDGYGDYTLVAYGTVAQWTNTLNGKALTLSTGNPGYAYDADSGKDPIFGRSGGRVQYTNVLVWDELADVKYNEDIVMRPFIKLRKGTQELVIYGGIVSRSIYYVAQQNADRFPKGSAGYKYVHGIIDKVNALNSSTDTTT